MQRFLRFQLRTIDVLGAREFYARVLGEDDIDIILLPEQAVARGAPAHWLGYLPVEAIDDTVRSFVGRGATPLGQIREADGGQAWVLRDPAGAVVALSTPSPGFRQPQVVWLQLYCTNIQDAAAAYCDLFGWQLTDRRDLGALGVHQEFAWRAGEPAVGSFVDIAGFPGIHSHWLFYFRVPTLDPALAIIRASGGTVIGPTRLPNGDLVAVCEDPQGAAFALCELAKPVR